MKKIVIAVLAITLFSCTKQAEKQSATEETKRGRGHSQQAELSVTSDLVLTESNGVLTLTISPNAQWAGVQKFVDMSTNDGAVSVCNWNYTTAPTLATCTISGSGFYRGWTSDFNYDVHLSNIITIP